jgi:Rrf2 family protein
MMDLALQPGENPVSLKDAAKRQDISLKYLEQIAGLLGRAGFVQSVRGPQGGYRLTREPKNYSLGEILRLTEGNLAPVSCLADKDNPCARHDQCGTLDFWAGLYQQINQYIDRFTLQDLVENERRKHRI